MITNISEAICNSTEGCGLDGFDGRPVVVRLVGDPSPTSVS